MKYNFNFIQVANWVYVIRGKLKDFRLRLDKEKVSKQDALENLNAQKKYLQLIKDILERNIRLVGVQKDFITNLKDIKKQYGIEE